MTDANYDRLLNGLRECYKLLKSLETEIKKDHNPFKGDSPIKELMRQGMNKDPFQEANDLLK